MGVKTTLWVLPANANQGQADAKRDGSDVRLRRCRCQSREYIHVRIIHDADNGNDLRAVRQDLFQVAVYLRIGDEEQPAAINTPM